MLGLNVLRDHGWIQTFGLETMMNVQISVASEGGSGAPVPDLSIEAADLDAALGRINSADFPIEYGLLNEPWGVRRFYVRDPFGKLVNVREHI